MTRSPKAVIATGLALGLITGVAGCANGSPEKTVVKTVGGERAGGDRYVVTRDELGKLCVDGTFVVGQGGNLTGVAQAVLTQIEAPRTDANTVRTVRYLGRTGGKDGSPLQSPNSLLPGYTIVATDVCSVPGPGSGSSVERILQLPVLGSK